MRSVDWKLLWLGFRLSPFPPLLIAASLIAAAGALLIFVHDGRDAGVVEGRVDALGIVETKTGSRVMARVRLDDGRQALVRVYAGEGCRTGSAIRLSRRRAPLGSTYRARRPNPCSGR